MERATQPPPPGDTTTAQEIICKGFKALAGPPILQNSVQIRVVQGFECQV